MDAEKNEIVVKLQEPISWGAGKTIEEVRIGTIRGKHVKGLTFPPTPAQLIVIASKVSGVEQAVFDEMNSKDLFKVLEAVGERL
jgi:hypothetical protein